MPRLQGLSANEAAFLDMIAISEIGQPLLNVSDDGYNVLVGSTPDNPHLFDSYADHPNVLVTINSNLQSTAAGRYQLLHRWWEAYKTLLNLPDFSPESQDRVALQQIKERKAINDINDGDIKSAIIKCSNLWASLPGNDYGQHQNKFNDLIAAFKSSGGVVNG